MKIHSYYLHVPLCAIFAPNSGYIARYAPFIWLKPLYIEKADECVEILAEHEGKTVAVRYGVQFGRALLENEGENAFHAGASAAITGNMLTTAACATIRSDREMVAGMGRDVKPKYPRQLNDIRWECGGTENGKEGKQI